MQGVGIWASLGFSDGKSNFLKRQYSAGISFNGMYLARPQDMFAISYFYLDPSDDFPPELGIGTSSGIEIYYNYAVSPWLQISPHIQFLFDPGTSQGTDDLTVAGIRVLTLF